MLLAALACRGAAAWRNQPTPTQTASLSMLVHTAPPQVASPVIPTPAPPLPGSSSPTAAAVALPQPTDSLPPASNSALPTEAAIAPTVSPLNQATLSAALATPTPLPTATSPAPVVADPAATGRHLQIFEELWGVIRDNYLYADFNGTDWNAVGQDYRARISAGMSDEQFYQAMHTLVQSLGDEHSTYFSPPQAAQRDREFQGDNSYVGIGVMTAIVPERQRLTVLLVFPGSPAEAAGLRAHDSLLAVDGQPLVDAGGSRQTLLRGPVNSSLELTVQTPGEEPRQVHLVRQPVGAQLPVTRFALSSPGGKRIGYIFIPTFNEMNIDEQVEAALTELSAGGPLDGLILDNRYNGGGASDVLLNTLSYFVDGPVGNFIERQEETELRVRGRDIGGSQSIPLVVLVGEGTASFGEVFAGSLKDLNRAHLIGTVTDGNVEVLSVFDFSDRSRAWIATASFRPWNSTEQHWEETGIIPDQIVDTEWDLVTTETDPAILAARAYFDK
jgi:carboxyl-terminal processing protease